MQNKNKTKNGCKCESNTANATKSCAHNTKATSSKDCAAKATKNCSNKAEMATKASKSAK